MNKVLALVTLMVSLAVSVAAQEKSATDLSRYEVLEEDEKLMTLTDLQAMEDEYKMLVKEGKCSDALPKIVAFHEAANKTANIIRRGNKPFYDASRDDQTTIKSNIPLIRELASAENTSNNLVRQRNRAWVEEAKCLLEQGESKAAVHRLFRALDYIGTDINEKEVWEEARYLIWKEVEFTHK